MRIIITSGLFIILILISALILSCRKLESGNNEQPIARVQDKLLLPSEILDIFPAGLSEQDSLVILRNFTEKWIKKQLILQKAELNLNEAQKDVSRQIEEYRSSLLIFKYEQSLIKQKLDTIINSGEIENYYTENSSNFILDNIIVKALFIKLPFDAPNLDVFRSLYRQEDEESVRQLESYCYQYAVKYDYFNDNWIILDNILRELPEELNNPEWRLKYYDYIEQQDSTYRYFVHIRDYKLDSEIAPLEYVENNIRSIILNKRKLKFVQNLENNIYNDALNKGQFIIY
jgi:hypothetical protein